MPATEGAQKRDRDVITLGSGKLLLKEYNSGDVLTYDMFDDDEDLLGYISGGATLTYSSEWYDAMDDYGTVIKTIITSEEATLTSGIVTWNGNTLDKLVSTAEVTDSDDVRIVKIGGMNKYNGKSYAICFHHPDTVDGDVWVIIRGVNQSELEIAFQKDQETVIDAEFKCLPQDDDGTLIQYVEQIKDDTDSANGGNRG